MTTPVRSSHVCADPFHLCENADTFEHRCGHQVFEWPCGWTVDDHDYEECDGRTVAELEESRAGRGRGDAAGGLRRGGCAGESAVSRTWRMFAGRNASPARPWHRFGDERTVRFCGLDPVAVELTEDSDGGYYGWLKTGADTPVMIQGHEGMFRMQSPDGFRCDVERGRGEIVRMSCRAVG